MTDLYMANYHLPQQVENLRRKMRQLEERAFELGDEETRAIIGAAITAWDKAEMDATLARMARAVEGIL